jgi:hypothetical protein
MTQWERIDGFTSPAEYERFVAYIEAQVAAGIAREVAVDRAYGRGEIYGGRWFEDLQTGRCWRLVDPDPPFRGVWEPVTPTVD